MKPEEAIAFLMDRHLVDARDLVQGHVRVEDHSARNQSLAVRCSTRTGFFLKQGTTGDSPRSLDTEAAVYTLANGNERSRLTALKPYLPEFHRFDPDRQLLTIALVADSATARVGVLGVGGLAEVGGQLGRALAACHSAGTEDDLETRAAFSEMLPWAFRVALPEPDMFRGVGPLQLQLIRLIQQQRDIVDRIRELRRQWRCSAFTHGDVRWTNVLIVEPDEVRLIDWEAAGIGDPAWDVACAFEGWLSHGLESLELPPDSGPAEASVAFAKLLPAVQQQTRAFWQAYASETEATPQIRRTFLDRATAYTGARLLQSAHEWSAGRPTFTPFILLTVQLAVNLLRQSADARAAVLGIDDP